MNAKIKLVVSIIIIVLLFESCKTNKKTPFKKNSDLCEVLVKMNYDDQVNRLLLTEEKKWYGDLFHSLLDSLEINVQEFRAFSEEKKAKYRSDIKDKIKLQPNKPLTEQDIKRNDSLWKVQIKLDNINTELLIGIIKERGYPNKDNCDCELINNYVDDGLIGVIFRHSQPKYFNEIRALVTIEHNQGRMSLKTYEFIIDHLNGRPNSGKHKHI